VRGAECVDYCGRNEGVGMSGAGQRWAARSLSRAKSSRNWARWLCPWRYGRGKRHTGIRWAWSVTLHITVQHDPLITDEQDELLDLFRLNQRCLVVHFGSATAQRVGRAYAPGGAREVFFARGQAGFNAETQRNAEKRGEEALCEPLRTSANLCASALNLRTIEQIEHCGGQPAELEVGDMADSEVCATVQRHA